MAYTTTYTFTALELLTAAKMNAIQSNISSIWTGTTAGDVDYYTSSSAKTRLGIGTEYQFLQVNSGATAPAWGGLHYASVYRSATMTANSGTQTEILWNAEISDTQGWHSTAVNTGRITIGVTGKYMVSVYLQYTTTGGSGTYRDSVECYRNGSGGTLVGEDRRYQEVEAYHKTFSITFPIIGATAADYFNIYLTQNSGLAGTVAANSRMSVMRID